MLVLLLYYEIVNSVVFFKWTFGRQIRHGTSSAVYFQSQKIFEKKKTGTYFVFLYTKTMEMKSVSAL